MRWPGALGDGARRLRRKALVRPMVQFVLLVVLVSTTCFVIHITARALSRRCRYRCRCVADSVALGALRSIAENSSVRHDEI